MKKNEIIRSYGTEYKKMTKDLLSAANLAAEIAPGAKIGLKPNLVCPSPAKFGGTTHTEILEGIIEYLRENGFNNIGIYEGSWVGDTTEDSFEYCGYNTLSKEYNVPLFDTQKDGSFKADCAGLEMNICNCTKDIDFLINVPVLKGHCQTKITCALKNMKGLITNSEKRHFHAQGLHKPIAHLNTYLKPDFIVIDHICGDPDFEEGGNPLVRNCIMVAKDPVLVDAFAAQVLGYQTEDIPYIKMAEELGVGTADLSKLNLSTLEGTPCEEEPLERKILAINYAAEEVDSCSACYGNLMGALRKLNEEGLLEKLNTKIGIGQGYKEKSGKLGVGLCTKNFDFNIPGCPPTEEDMYEGLKRYIREKC